MTPKAPRAQRSELDAAAQPRGVQDLIARHLQAPWWASESSSLMPIRSRRAGFLRRAVQNVSASDEPTSIRVLCVGHRSWRQPAPRSRPTTFSGRSGAPHVGGGDPQVWPAALDGLAEEGCHPLVDLAARSFGSSQSRQIWLSDIPVVLIAMTRSPWSAVTSELFSGSPRWVIFSLITVGAGSDLSVAT